MKTLQQGDHIRIIATAGRVDPELFAPSVKILEDWGLKVLVSDQVLEREGYFAGSDEARLEALQMALDDEECKAIFCARGGYGTTRIFDRADYDRFRSSPKWIIGFSDVTSLHLKMLKFGIPSVHGPMPVQYGKPEFSGSLEKLHELLFKGSYSYKVSSSKGSVPGQVSAELVGGNLTLIADSLGTPTEIDTNGKILFLEEIGEDIYRVDRMLHQLRRAGKLKQLKALMVGQFTGIRDTNPSFEMDLEDLLLRVVPKNIPALFGFPAGHEHPNYPLLFGVKHSLVIGNEESALSILA